MAVRVRRWSDVEARQRPLHRAAYANSTPSPAPVAPASAEPAPIAQSVKNVPLAVMEDAPECVICLDELEMGRALFTAECGHRFHFSCLLENVNHDEANSDKCPICRKTQTQWPEQTEGLVKAHPYCTNCGKRGSGGQFCDGCGQSLAHTPTAQERARAAAAAAAARSNVVVECPTCRIRCLVSTTARGTLQCPNGHLFQLRMPPSTGNSQGLRQSFNGGGPISSGPRPIMRQCPTCYTRVQMPPGSQAGQYMCPHGHTFYFSPFQ
ncbi:hypothetical protein PF010_g17632 [Phytophthora fragariae]|uniref:RING-type domain-containing protein n=2 Tax=Phytophthora fragariae TaxID=53985 RepID=A0A6A3EE37_9STRA|nr:hypothetical protein PF003_g25737 [Phytophthora fragariae]KAE8930456.1 hypothetical protein PF009_g19457 [Phytophthora fragariae]KAE8993848.1 hypothetical protein PF011_g16974 [Phytophthora fragariae]KAE9092418.1 hypothetical protein PF007_g18522 [Phytophthora fragariae]KAE9093081.1 hypothetical protein PF010_g17632 [Phytophthora fragariae]